MNLSGFCAESFESLVIAARRAKHRARQYAAAIARGQKPLNTDRECARRRSQIARGALKPQSRGL